MQQKLNPRQIKVIHIAKKTKAVYKRVANLESVENPYFKYITPSFTP
jgi:hypothetical protein